MASTIAIAIATAGRRTILEQVIRHLGEQERLPDELLICPASPDDADRAWIGSSRFPMRIVEGPRGLPAQRNRLLAETTADLLLFLDDDFLPAPDYIVRTQEIFEAREEIVMTTGTVIADGILGPGLTMEDGLASLSADHPPTGSELHEVHNGYGCNMALRMAPVRARGLLFDERLPLYGWLEDVDFSRRLRESGRIVRADRCRGVHLGTKRGRTSGVKLGYSQIANPYYLARKGSLSYRFALRHMSRNLAANAARSLRAEPWVDRVGRLRGNLMALGDLLRARIDPQRILDLS